VEIVNIGIVGLGKMGNAIAQRLVQAGYEVIGYDLNREALDQAHKIGVETASSLKDLAYSARIIWLMVPVGKPVDDTIEKLIPHLKGGDIIIDGGNSKFTDSIRRAQMLKPENIFFLDCGTSGGLQGRAFGFSLMVGGDEASYTKIHPLLVAIAAPGGVGYVGPSGAGHYVKMVHNSIEYALLQAYAEGFQLLKQGSFKDTVFNLEHISNIWLNGSIIRSWILELTRDVFREYGQKFDDVIGEIQEGGTGRWSVEDAHKNHIPVRLIEESLKIREWSRKTGGNYSTKIVALLRNVFGGHSVKRKTKKITDEEV